MGDKPMMKCGHAANATTFLEGNERAPVCVICVGVDPGARIVDDSPPDLSGRMAKCSYDNAWSQHVGHNGNRAVQGPVPSSPHLAFFKHLPDKEFDSYFCGCWGWD